MVGDSKELAKYVFDKFCKKAVNNGLTIQDTNKTSFSI